MTSVPAPSVLVLGAGPSGLTAAYRLAQSGFRVTILDAASTPGGSLATFPNSCTPIFGSHHTTWKLLHDLGTTQSHERFQQIGLEFALQDGRVVRYPTCYLPRPLHIPSSLSRFRGLSWNERWALLSWLEQLWEGALHLPTDLEHRTAADWLGAQGQSRLTLDQIWNPLAYWLTGNGLHHLSADAFVAAVKTTFLSQTADHRLYAPNASWDRLLIQPIVERLASQDTIWLPDRRITQFEIGADRVTGVRSAQGTLHRADWYVSALPYQQFASLLPERWLTRYAYFQHLTELTPVPMNILEIQTNQPFTALHLVLTNSPSCGWLRTNRSDAGNHTVITAAFSHPPEPQPTEQIVTDLLLSLKLISRSARVLSQTPIDSSLSHLSLAPGTKVKRPIPSSPIANLLVTGAWTDTGWPANLESAIVSGERCAGVIAAGKSA